LSSASLSRWWRPNQPGCHATCSNDYGPRFLANFWQMAVGSAPGMEAAGCRTRPELLVCGGAPPELPSAPIPHREPERGNDQGRLELGHGDAAAFGHPGRPEPPEQRVHRRPHDVAADQVTGRLGRGASLGGDVGDTGVVGQLLEHPSRCAPAAR
jgi:hypothetical protein